jgi:16S rRNA (uracil1498-N3)-methyltransferase
LPVHLVLALPRPRMLARSLEHVTALGVKRITLLHTRRVEKSYWMSPELAPEKIRTHLVLGLEQARDTRLPEVSWRRASAPSSRTGCPTC